MTHFYGTEEELNIWLAQRTEQALAGIALGQVYTPTQVREHLAQKSCHHASI